MLVEVGPVADEPTLERVLGVARALAAALLPGVTDIVPSFNTVTVHYDPAAIPAGPGAPVARVAEWLRLTAATAKPIPGVPGREVVVPVCYGGEFGPDLTAVARRAGMEEAEVIRLHSSVRYRVAAVGFAPGFPYLLGLPLRLHMPRRANPRVSVPMGSVGIGGSQTGVYPFATPGGWQLIGRTPLRFFRPESRLPSLLYPGDYLRFKPIAASEWAEGPPAEAPQPGPDKPTGLSKWTRLIPRRAASAPAKLPAAEAVPAVAVTEPLVPEGAVEIVRVAGLAIIQDLGRTGWQRVGVTPGGAMDRQAARVANLLLGNPENAPLLECALAGPDLSFHAETWITVTGAAVEGVAGWRPLRMAAGTQLSLAKLTRGAHLYVAVAGGFAVPSLLGGAGTLLRAGFGGFHGRALRAGDRLVVGPRTGSLGAGRGDWAAAWEFWTAHGSEVTVRFVRGRRWPAFDEAARTAFKTAAWRIGPQSDRMGLRLSGPVLTAALPGELISSGVTFGSVQVPPNGQPIVLMADRQTLGGYPKIAHVIAADLPRLAQVRPGDTVRFAEIPVAEAQALAAEMEKSLALLRLGVAAKLRG